MPSIKELTDKDEDAMINVPNIEMALLHFAASDVLHPSVALLLYGL
jgi:hypothetical protein